MSCKLIEHPDGDRIVVLSSKTEAIGILENRTLDNIRIVSIGYLNDDSHLYFYKKEEWEDFVELINIINDKYKEEKL